MSDLIVTGFQLMLIGMTVVFCFLVLLVGLINLSTKVIARYAPASPQPVQNNASTQAPAPAGSNDSAIIAAITSAIKMHRAKR